MLFEEECHCEQYESKEEDLEHKACQGAHIESVDILAISIFGCVKIVWNTEAQALVPFDLLCVIMYISDFVLHLLKLINLNDSHNDLSYNENWAEDHVPKVSFIQCHRHRDEERGTQQEESSCHSRFMVECKDSNEEHEDDLKGILKKILETFREIWRLPDINQWD
jgi:hypothetical protein